MHERTVRCGSWWPTPSRQQATVRRQAGSVGLAVTPAAVLCCIYLPLSLRLACRPSGWFFKRLPRGLQQVPECWLRLSQQQRSLAVSGAIASAVLLLCLAILVAAWSGGGGSHKQQLQYTPKVCGRCVQLVCWRLLARHTP